MRIIIILLVIMLTGVTAFANIQLTQEQFDNIDLLHKEILKTYPQFGGFNGSRKNMEVLGITDKQAMDIIKVQNINQLRKEDPYYKERKKVRNKLKGLGLTDDGLSNMRLPGYIPDQVEIE